MGESIGAQFGAQSARLVDTFKTIFFSASSKASETLESADKQIDEYAKAIETLMPAIKFVAGGALGCLALSLSATTTLLCGTVSLVHHLKLFPPTHRLVDLVKHLWKKAMEYNGPDKEKKAIDNNLAILTIGMMSTYFFPITISLITGGYLGELAVEALRGYNTKLPTDSETAADSIKIS